MGKAAAVVCWHGITGQPHTHANYKRAPDSDLTRSPRWWRGQLPPGVSFRLSLYPHGDDTAEAMASRISLGTWSAVAELPAVPAPTFEHPDRVGVRLPDGTLRRARFERVQAVSGVGVFLLELEVGDELAPESWRALLKPARGSSRSGGIASNGRICEKTPPALRVVGGAS